MKTVGEGDGRVSGVRTTRPISNSYEGKTSHKGLTPSGFRQDGTDPEASTKEAMLQDLYRRADERLPPGLGGNPPPASETAGAQDEE